MRISDFLENKEAKCFHPVAFMAYSTSTLAQGCFGKVYKEKYNDTWAAVKRVPFQLISKKDLERECDVYNKANHPNIVKLLGNITLKDQKWVIPLEFIFGEDLETTIFKSAKSKIKLTPENKGTIIVGMCDGLLHLHSKDIVHQDLKPENIMVEHETNRAVIIDLGLAKFFRRGLNSAVDMGNEAYSAPEVLQRHSQRDQRSDVWAMGKIIAELCARVRLYTPTVCPAKIRETLKDQPFCEAICKMVESDPSRRTTMGGVIGDIRRARDVTRATASHPRLQKDHLRPSSPHKGSQDRAPSPLNRGRSPARGEPRPMERARSPFYREASPMKREPLPFQKDKAPMERARSPFYKDPSPMARARSPFYRDPSPMKHNAPPFYQAPSPMKRVPSPFYKDASPARQQGSSSQGSKEVTPEAEDRKQGQSLSVPDLSQDFAHLNLHQNLPCNLPTTGRVVVRRFVEKDGEVGTWEQTEVVTRDGKIVKYDDVKFNSS